MAQLGWPADWRLRELRVMQKERGVLLVLRSSARLTQPKPSLSPSPARRCPAEERAPAMAAARACFCSLVKPPSLPPAAERSGLASAE